MSISLTDFDGVPLPLIAAKSRALDAQAQRRFFPAVNGFFDIYGTGDSPPEIYRFTHEGMYFNTSPTALNTSVENLRAKFGVKATLTKDADGTTETCDACLVSFSSEVPDQKNKEFVRVRLIFESIEEWA